MKCLATQTALNSGSDMLPGWSSHFVQQRRAKRKKMCMDINGIAIRAVVAAEG